MLKFIFSFLGLILFSSRIYAGESQVEKSFNLKDNTEVVGKWIQSHREDLKKAGGCEIIEHKNNKIRVSKDTLKGKMEWTEELKEEQGDNGWLFTSSLIEVHQGNIVDNNSKVYVIDDEKGGCAITLQISSKVKNVTASQIKRELNSAAKKIQELFEQNFNHFSQQSQPYLSHKNVLPYRPLLHSKKMD